MDILIVGICVLLAAIYLVRRAMRFFSGVASGTPTGCAGCACSCCQDTKCSKRQGEADGGKRNQ